MKLNNQTPTTAMTPAANRITSVNTLPLLRRNIMLATFVLAATLGTAQAVMDRPPVVVTQDSPSPKVRPITAQSISVFEQAKNTSATGFYHVSNIRHQSGSQLAVYGVLNNGALIEVHGKKGGSWAVKQAGSHSVRTISAANFDQLMSFQGRNMKAASAADKARFAQLTGVVFGNTPNQPQPSAPPAPTAPCNKLKSNCDPLTALEPLMRIADGLMNFLVSNAHAADNSLQYFKFSLFGIEYEYNPQGGYAAFSGFGVNAIWTLP
jgi:hypothetical protein